jgi:lantibiotic transport system permease protein
MNALMRCLAGEILKLRGTLALRMCLIAPLVVVALYVLQMTLMERRQPPMPPSEAWEMLVKSIFGLWSLLMLPLFVTLQAALLAGLEHRDRHWKHLLALPLPRHAHYLAKTGALLALIALAQIALAALIPLGGWALSALQPRFGIAGPPPFAMIAELSLPIWIGALLMASVQLCISIRWSSFTVAVATGMTATVMGFLIGQSQRYGPWYPWSMPVQALANKQQHLELVMATSAIGAIVVTALASFDFSRREFND